MKKSILTLIMLVIVTSLFAGSFDRWGLEAQVGYSTVSANVEDSEDSNVRKVGKLSGIGTSIGASFRINPKVSVEVDGQYIFPYYIYGNKKDGSKVTVDGQSRKQMETEYSNTKMYGYKFHLGFGYSLTDYSRIYIEPVLNAVIQGGYLEGIYHGGAKHKTTFFALGIGTGFKAGCFLSPNFAITAHVQPDFIFYSVIDNHTAGEKKEKDACFEVSVTAMLGAKFVF